MSEETLFTAARRLARFVNINMSHDGGMITQETERALLTLEKEIERERERLKNLNADNNEKSS